MDDTRFMIAYILFIAIVIVIELLLLLNYKEKYLNRSYIALLSVCEFARSHEIGMGRLNDEIEKFYKEYVQEYPQIKRYYPNVLVWIEAIIFRIDCGNIKAIALKDYLLELKEVRDYMTLVNPFNKCEKYQQDILNDIVKLGTLSNNDFMQNIICRTEEEFLRLSGDIRKNKSLNIVSIAIGAIGIIVSVLMAIMQI